MQATSYHYYRFFDRTVASNEPIAELVPCDTRPDDHAVTVLFNKQHSYEQPAHWHHQWLLENGTVSLSLAKEQNCFLLVFPNRLVFRLAADSSQISVEAGTLTPPETVHHLLLDQVLPRCFAHFCGYTIAHGACVVRQGRGICLLGDTGRGKSTLAGGFFRTGWTVATDDCFQLIIKNTTVLGLPSYPSLRLLSDSRAVLGFDRQPGTNVAHYSDKMRVTPEFGGIEPVPIDAFVFLQPPLPDNEPICIAPTGSTGAFSALMRNSFVLDVHDKPRTEAHFRRVAALAGLGVPCATIAYPRRFELLDKVVATIIGWVDRSAQDRS